VHFALLSPLQQGQLDVFAKTEKNGISKRFWIWFITLLLGVICGVSLAWWHMSMVNRSSVPVHKVPETTELQKNNNPGSETEKIPSADPKKQGENTHASPVA
jgi:hypothetical protein